MVLLEQFLLEQFLLEQILLEQILSNGPYETRGPGQSDYPGP